LGGDELRCGEYQGYPGIAGLGPGMPKRYKKMGNYWNLMGYEWNSHGILMELMYWDVIGI
jgi:hypothetical protein